MAVLDARGVEIKEGDLVIYTSPGQNSMPVVGYVHKLSATKVTLRDADPRYNNDTDYNQARINDVMHTRNLIQKYKDEGRGIPEWLEKRPKTVEDVFVYGGHVAGTSCYVVTGLPFVEGRLNS